MKLRPLVRNLGIILKTAPVLYGSLNLEAAQNKKYNILADELKSKEALFYWDKETDRAYTKTGVPIMVPMDTLDFSDKVRGNYELVIYSAPKGVASYDNTIITSRDVMEGIINGALIHRNAKTGKIDESVRIIVPVFTGKIDSKKISRLERKLIGIKKSQSKRKDLKSESEYSGREKEKTEPRYFEESYGYGKGEEDINKGETEWEELAYGDEINWEERIPNVITESKTKNNWDAFYNTHLGLAIGAVIDDYTKSVNTNGEYSEKAARGGLELGAFLKGPNSETDFDLRFLNDNDGYINKTKEGELSFVYTPHIINFEGASISPALGAGLEGCVSSDNESISNELMNLRTNTQGEFSEMIKWLGLGGKINAGDFSIEALYKFLEGNMSLKVNSETFEGTDLIAKYDDVIRTLASGNALKVGLGYNNNVISLRGTYENGNKVYVPLTNNASIIDNNLNVEYNKFSINGEIILPTNFTIGGGFTAEKNHHAPSEKKDLTGAEDKFNRTGEARIGYQF